MNISPDCDAEAQLTACRSTQKHARRLFPPVWTQKLLFQKKCSDTSIDPVLLFLYIAVVGTVQALYLSFELQLSLKLRLVCSNLKTIFYNVTKRHERQHLPSS